MALEYYAYVNNYFVDVPQKQTKIEQDNIPSLVLDEPKDITLAQYSPLTSDLITAHNLKDYRRKVFTLLLLPKAEIMFDKVLEGSSYYSEFLQSQDIYS